MVGRRVPAAAIVAVPVAATACGSDSSDSSDLPGPDVREVWAVQIGSTQSETSYGVAATPDGQAIVTASTEGDLAGQNQGQRDESGRGSVLMWLNSFGVPVGGSWFGSEAEEEATGLDVAVDGTIYWSGNSTGAYAGDHAGKSDLILAGLAVGG